MGFIQVNSKQGNLLGYCLDDFVDEQAKCRFVRALVQELDLSKLHARYSDKGTDAIDPAILLATWFFAYSERIFSTRKLEQACRRDLHFIYISGNLQPDHTTLARFRQNHLDLLEDYFVALIVLAMKKGLTAFSSVALDGTKLQASCSRKQNRTSDELEKALACVRQEIADYMQRCDRQEQADSETPDDLRTLRDKIQELQAREKLLVERQQQLEARKQELKPEDRAQHKINLVEPEALVMQRVNGDQARPAYNAQLTVDTQSLLIGAHDVVQDRTDQNQFAPQYEKLNATVGHNPERQHTADSGYHTLAQLEFVAQHEIDAVLADPAPQHRATQAQCPKPENLLQEQRKLTPADFVYHAEENYYECPAGGKLVHKKTQTQDGHRVQIYQKEGCHACALAHLCLAERNQSGIRNLRRDEREILAERMQQLLKTDAARLRLKLRAQSVEPVFGILKEHFGFRRFHLRGLKKVQGEFTLLCLAYNISRLYVLLKGDLHSPSGSDDHKQAQFFVLFLLLVCWANIQNRLFNIIWIGNRRTTPRQ